VRGYKVLEAADGEEGLKIARQHHGKINLAFTDIVMPILGGKAMADELRAFSADTKVLYTSGYTEDTIGNHGVLKPGIAFLQKPYLMATLACRVREVLDAGVE
jgi:DNA-binding response OmpR family regulator